MSDLVWCQLKTDMSVWQKQNFEVITIIIDKHLL